MRYLSHIICKSCTYGSHMLRDQEVFVQCAILKSFDQARFNSIEQVSNRKVHMISDQAKLLQKAIELNFFYGLFVAT